MRWWRRLVSVVCMLGLLTGCDALRDQAPGRLVVNDAQVLSTVDGAQLALAIELQLNGPMSDALEHGIPITLHVHLQGNSGTLEIVDQRDVELRYFPLSRRYQLRDGGTDTERSFAASGYLMDALAALRLPLPKEFSALPAGSRMRVAVQLDHSALPGPLRLPAILEPAWRLKAPEFVWTVAAG
jgi:hypothetical protein